MLLLRRRLIFFVLPAIWSVMYHMSSAAMRRDKPARASRGPIPGQNSAAVPCAPGHICSDPLHLVLLEASQLSPAALLLGVAESQTRTARNRHLSVVICCSVICQSNEAESKPEHKHTHTHTHTPVTMCAISLEDGSALCAESPVLCPFLPSPNESAPALKG